MKTFIFALLALALAALPALAVPDCYTDAALPAHVWAVEGSSDPNAVVTSIDAFDDKTCIHTPLWKGKPVFRQEMYVTWNQLYEAYAKAIQSKNGEALDRIHAWLRPRPRTVESWLRLRGFEPPQPWGMKMFQTVGKVVATMFADTINVQYATFEYAEKYNKMGAMWLFLHMGGIVIKGPDENIPVDIDSIEIKAANDLLQSMISGNFLFGVRDTKKKCYVLYHLTN